MNTITTTTTTTANAIAHAINNANTGVFASMFELGQSLSHAHKNGEFDGYKSWNAFKKANIENRTFKMGASSLDNAEKGYEFLCMDCVSFCAWSELTWTALVILMGAVKYNDELVEFVNQYSDMVAKMKQKELQRFAKLLKEGATIKDAFKSATEKMPKDETIGKGEPTEEGDAGEGVETKVAIKATLQNILAMMQCKEYDNAETTLVELLATM